MYKTIVNPETGRKVNVNGKIGQKVLNNYKKQYGGLRYGDFNLQTQDEARAQRRQAKHQDQLDKLRHAQEMSEIDERSVEEQKKADVRNARGYLIDPENDWREKINDRQLGALNGLIQVLTPGGEDANEYIYTSALDIVDSYKYYESKQNHKIFFEKLKDKVELARSEQVDDTLKQNLINILQQIISYLDKDIQIDMANSDGATCPQEITYPITDKTVETPNKENRCCDRNTGRVINIPYLPESKFGTSRAKVLVPLKQTDSIYCKSKDDLIGEISTERENVSRKDRLMGATRAAREGLYKLTHFPPDSDCADLRIKLEDGRVPRDEVYKRVTKCEEKNSLRHRSEEKGSYAGNQVKVKSLDEADSVLDAAAAAADAAAALTPGQEIEARYKGGKKYYPGTVSAKNDDGTFNIAYDDGDVEEGVWPSMVRARAPVAQDKPSGLFSRFRMSRKGGGKKKSPRRKSKKRSKRNNRKR
jgi:hypothetical protein